jgi:hypothetical protein
MNKGSGITKDINSLLNDFQQEQINNIHSKELILKIEEKK